MLRLALLISLFACAVGAQDHQYWTHQFGTRSGLRGGIVLGGCEDTSAVYYNPGRVGWLKNDALKVSADAYQLSVLTMQDGAGEGQDLGSVEGDIVPLAAAGVFLFDGAPGHALGFQIMARQFFNARASARREALLNVIDDTRSAGPEDYIGNFDLYTSTEEYWAGLCYSWAVTDWISFGVSHFGALRFEDIENDATTRAVNGASAYGADIHFGVDYWDVRIVTKAGLAVDLGAIKLGFTVTFPSVHLLGFSTVKRQVTVNDLDFNGDGTADNFEANARQSSVPSQFRSPWSFASGLDWNFGINTLAFAWEWFLPVGKYAAAKPDHDAPYLRGGLSTGGARDFLTVYDGRRGAFNFGLSGEHRFLPDWSALWSFRSDYAADYLWDEQASLGISTWDLWHITHGIAYTTRQEDGSPKHEFLIGLALGFGAGKGKQPVNFDAPEETRLLLSASQNKVVSYFSLGLVVGYTYYF